MELVNARGRAQQDRQNRMQAGEGGAEGQPGEVGEGGCGGERGGARTSCAAFAPQTLCNGCSIDGAAVPPPVGLTRVPIPCRTLPYSPA